MGRNILVVDDERGMRDSLRGIFEFEGYEVATAPDGRAALDRLRDGPADLLVLDVMMPVMDGVTVCRRLRGAGDRTPILMLSARDAVGDRVTGLDAGADDYLPKPFELDELLARVRALLRRTALDEPGDVLAYADLVLDRTSREASRAGVPFELTRTEYDLLEFLLAHPRRVLTREEILGTVWGFDADTVTNALDMYVMYLRRKTEAGGLPRLIHTVRGVGFVLRG